MATTKQPKKSGSKKPKQDTAPQGEGFSGEMKAIRKEFDKITWPTVPQIWGNTITVIVMTALVSLGMWAADNVFAYVIWLLTEQIPKFIM